jgi:hypothetical protein
MYQIFPEEENSNVKSRARDGLRLNSLLTSLQKMAYEGRGLFLAKMLFAADLIRMRRESGLRPLRVLSVAIYGLVLVPPGRGG